MKEELEIFKHIQIDENSRIPKYRQIVDSIVHQISIKNIKREEKIPSINNFSKTLRLSRDTVEKAYNILKEKSIVSSVPGKGHYIEKTKLISEVSILFLINKLSTYRAQIYNSFIETIGNNCHNALQISHCDSSLFLKLLQNNRNAYDYYALMPNFKTEDLLHLSYTDDMVSEINKIEKEKLILFDNQGIGFDGNIIEIYQDFEKDIYDALKEGLPKIKKYSRLILVYPENAVYPYPKGIVNGFCKFCVEYSINFEIFNAMSQYIILEKDNLFITVEESDLVNLIDRIREYGFIPGTEIGLISCNDTPLKKLMGITCISADFSAMGVTAARMVLKKEKGKIKNPFYFIDRNSL